MSNGILNRKTQYLDKNGRKVSWRVPQVMFFILAVGAISTAVQHRAIWFTVGGLFFMAFEGLMWGFTRGEHARYWARQTEKENHS